MKSPTISVTVNGWGVPKARLWMGCQLFRLAGAVMGCNAVPVEKSLRDQVMDGDITVNQARGLMP